MFVIRSLTYDAAEPLEVAMIVTILAAIAYFTGTPKATNTGIMMLPPPRPVKDPRNPAKIEMISTESMSINLDSGPSLWPISCECYSRTLPQMDSVLGRGTRSHAGGGLRPRVTLTTMYVPALIMPIAIFWPGTVFLSRYVDSES